MNINAESSNQSDELDLKIFNILVDWIKEHYKDKAPITYSELVNQVNAYSVIPVNVGIRLGRVSNYSRENGLPPISAIVGGLEFSEPGKGFFESLGLEGLTSDKRLEKWIMLLNEVYSTKLEDWETLLEQYENYINSIKNEK